MNEESPDKVAARASELRSKMVTGQALWDTSAPTTLIELPIGVVESIGNWPRDEHWDYWICDQIWEVCRRWCEKAGK